MLKKGINGLISKQTEVLYHSSSVGNEKQK